MKLEDPTDTWEFFMKGAGEAYVTAVDGFSASQNSISNAFDLDVEQETKLIC